jgi:protein arginine N-methyltransferase 5
MAKRAAPILVSVNSLNHLSPTLSFHIDAAIMLRDARLDEFDFVTCNLPTNLEPRADVTALDSRWWRTSIVGRMNAPSMAQMEWSQHMNIPAIIVPEVSMDDTDACQKLASMALVASASNGQIWVTTRLTEDSLNAFDSVFRFCDGAPNVGMMLTLDNERTVSTNATELVARQLVLIHKAIGSQLKALCLPTSVFLTNKRGYPALSKTHQVLFTEVLRRIGRTVRILLEGPSLHPVENSGNTACTPYLQYIRHLRTRAEISQVLDSDEASLEEAYLDQLQRPLQPLADQLEFSTYETFEKDPVKYRQYQKATFCALRRGLATLQGKPNDHRVTIMVVGAGRGPLVNAALRAIGELGIQFNFHIYAVEKNPSAVIYLKSLACNDPSWRNIVTVVHSDMRELDRKLQEAHAGIPNAGIPNASIPQADIVISELLGSFGDNELSPECLDGLRSTGIWKDSTLSIPCSYTAYLAPISSMKLHAEARAQSFFPATTTSVGLDSSPMGTQVAMETPYVVRTHAASQTHEEQPCWNFSHPSSKVDKERTCHLSFKPSPTHGAGCGSGYGPFDSAVAAIAQSVNGTYTGSVSIHGFVGTFEAILYDGDVNERILISTRPKTFSEGMFSWFPLYFPLREPLRVPGGSTVSCSIWRKTETNATGNGRVWYEWGARVTDPVGTVLGQSHIHNPNGRSYNATL